MTTFTTYYKHATFTVACALASAMLCSYQVKKVLPAADSAQIMTRLNEVPVLCYHQVRDWKASDSKNDRIYIIPTRNFKEQMQLLHDKGYHSILPEQLYNYALYGEKLPAKPILLTFDDGTDSQYFNALPELKKQGFKATFFIMTVTLNKHIFMSDKQVKELAADGNAIECHTWDHRSVTGYHDNDWRIEIKKPVERLQHITGAPVRYFAYPYGEWNEMAADKLKGYGFDMAFQLWGKMDKQHPLFTIKRILVSGYWNTKQLTDMINRATINNGLDG